MKWILILFMSNGGNGAAIDHIAFDDETSCHTAAVTITQAFSYRPAVQALCVPESGEN